MARELRRLLIDPERLRRRDSAEDRLPLQGEEQHYLSRVLRLRAGDPVAVIDGRGGLWQARCGPGAWLESFTPLATATENQAPRPWLTLALALPRREVELVWRMATELGIDGLQPLQADRCQPSERDPMPRWQSVVREATEQSERLWLPQLLPACSARLWMQEPLAGLRLVATTRMAALPLLEEALAAASPRPDAITLAVGAEGGWSPEEEELAMASGWQLVSLGAGILRSSTAAVSGAARLSAWRSLVSGPSSGG
ncbi:MAG: 16S rRNA (uracil(1498)-N(3))-methyltransferase [Synechococcus sp. ELA057]